MTIDLLRSALVQHLQQAGRPNLREDDVSEVLDRAVVLLDTEGHLNYRDPQLLLRL